MYIQLSYLLLRIKKLTFVFVEIIFNRNDNCVNECPQMTKPFVIYLLYTMVMNIITLCSRGKNPLYPDNIASSVILNLITPGHKA